MPWFKVDDSLHSHPKALAAGPAAMGLWVMAGSWSCANHQGGFVPDYVVPRLAEDASKLARKLVTAGLWTRAKGGYRFHDWDDRNPNEQEANAVRRKQAVSGALGNHRRWHVQRGIKEDGCPFCSD